MNIVDVMDVDVKNVFCHRKEFKLVKREFQALWLKQT